MAVIRTLETQVTSEYIAVVGLFCGIMCGVLALKFKFNLDLLRGSSLRETPTVVAGGVYKINQSEAYVGSAVSTTKYKSINPAKVQLPPPLPSDPPHLPSTPPPKFDGGTDVQILPNPISGVPVHDGKISENPNGEPIKIPKFPDIRQKTSKKLQKDLEKREKERVKDQRQRDKILIAEIIKEDSERIAREAKLIKERQKENPKSKKKEPMIETQVPTNAKSATSQENNSEPKPKLETANPLARVRLQSNVSSQSAYSGPPPPYSLDIARPNVNPSDTVSSGKTSFSRSMEGMGTWDLISQHRQEIHRPKIQKSAKIENSPYNVGNIPPPEKDVKAMPRKSL